MALTVAFVDFIFFMRSLVLSGILKLQNIINCLYWGKEPWEKWGHRKIKAGSNKPLSTSFSLPICPSVQASLTNNQLENQKYTLSVPRLLAKKFKHYRLVWEKKSMCQKKKPQHSFSCILFLYFHNLWRRISQSLKKKIMRR